jgi:hypothetical protein
MIDDIDLDQHHHMYVSHVLFPLELQCVSMLGQLAKYLAEALDYVSNNVAHMVVKINFIQEQVGNEP